MRAGITIASVAFVFTLAGCMDGRSFTTTDSWYNPPNKDGGFSPINKDAFAPVVEEFQQEAQQSLTDVAARQLAPDEAERLIGKKLPGSGVHVLLRAVVLNEGTGKFHVGVRGSAVHIEHGSLGHYPVPMRRKAIVVMLPAVPETVFVSCGMDA